MEERFNARCLELSPDLEVKCLPDGTRLLKEQKLGTYLAVSAPQWDLLQQCNGQRSVQDLVHALLLQHPRPSLREVYDVFAAAVARGILRDEHSQLPKPPKPASWPFGWGRWPALVSSLLLLATGVLIVLQAEIVLTESVSFLLLVYLGLIISLSLSNFLAGCVLRGLGRTVYDSRLAWLTIVPYLKIDRRDVFMAGRYGEVCVSLQALTAPMLVLLAGVALQSAALAVAALLALLVLSFPLGHTPMREFLDGILGRGYQMPRAGQAFLRRRLLQQLLSAGGTDQNYLLGYAAATIAWLSIVLLIVSRLAGSEAERLVRVALHEGPLVPRLMAALFLLTLVVLLFAPMIYEVFLFAENVYHYLLPRLRATEKRVIAAGGADKPPIDELLPALSEIMLFSQLSEPALRDLAEAMNYDVLPPGKVVVREGERGDHLFVVLSGKLTVTKEDAAGEPHVVAELTTGDIFGEVALVRDELRTATIATAVQTGLLSLSKEQFNAVVLEKLGARQVLDIIQVSHFLRRVELFADWPNQQLIAVTHRFETIEVSFGDVIINQGEDNRHFYLIYEGRFAVRRDGMQVAELQTGNFFGEISLLQDRPATADVVATDHGRLLRLDRDSFADFLSRDFLTGYQMENIIDQRLTELAGTEGWKK